MFKFNFMSDEEDNETEVSPSSQTEFLECKEILPENDFNLVDSLLKKVETKVLRTNNIEIKYLCSNSLVEFLKRQKSLEEESILKAEQCHSDLLPAVYEGGLKIWECTYDILDYFSANHIELKEKIVLDLGCGAGILGIFSLLKGASSWFQDYNIDVIKNITIPNVLLNSDEFVQKPKFFSGDWGSLVEIIVKNYPQIQFDYIITSETIYNTNYYEKIHLVFDKLLKKDGAIFLAAKSFYFGVGGGVHLFQDFLHSKKVFKDSNCWRSSEGVKREILKIEFL